MTDTQPAGDPVLSQVSVLIGRQQVISDPKADPVKSGGLDQRPEAPSNAKALVPEPDSRWQGKPIREGTEQRAIQMWLPLIECPRA